MLVVMPVCQDRLSPVLDVASHLMVCNIINGVVVASREVVLAPGTFTRRASDLAELGAQLLICGAVSESLRLALNARGVRVIAGKCGLAEQVLRAWQENRLETAEFQMPGCHLPDRRSVVPRARRTSKQQVYDH